MKRVGGDWAAWRGRLAGGGGGSQALGVRIPSVHKRGRRARQRRRKAWTRANESAAAVVIETARGPSVAEWQSGRVGQPGTRSSGMGARSAHLRSRRARSGREARMRGGRVDQRGLTPNLSCSRSIISCFLSSEPLSLAVASLAAATPGPGGQPTRRPHQAMTRSAAQ